MFRSRERVANVLTAAPQTGPRRVQDGESTPLGNRRSTLLTSASGRSDAVRILGRDASNVVDGVEYKTKRPKKGHSCQVLLRPIKHGLEGLMSSAISDKPISTMLMNESGNLS